MKADDLGSEDGLDGFEVSDTVALIDADTIVYAACSVSEYADDMLNQDMYSRDEWLTIVQTEGWDEDEMCIWRQNLDKAVEMCIARIDDIMLKTGTGSAELYFTSGRNFRHEVDSMYKANRKSTRYPVGLLEVKQLMLKEYEGAICDGIEADDAVVFLKKQEPDKYVLCAVDKDVYKSVPGKHWNYYYSDKHSIKPKWVVTSKSDADMFPYIQTLMGDSTDNIKGCPGIGPKKAESALKHSTDEFESWQIVISLFLSKGLTEADAIRDMRLVNMGQVSPDKDGGWVWNPWLPPHAS